MGRYDGIKLDTSNGARIRAKYGEMKASGRVQQITAGYMRVRGMHECNTRHG